MSSIEAIRDALNSPKMKIIIFIGDENNTKGNMIQFNTEKTN